MAEENKEETKPLSKKKIFSRVILMGVALGILGYLGYLGFDFIKQRLDAEKRGEVVQTKNPFEGISLDTIKEWTIGTLSEYTSKDFIFSLDGINFYLTVFIFLSMLYLSIKDQIGFLTDNHVDYKGPVVSLGVFGTFSGIFLGLYNFDVSNLDTSVPDLLGGLKTAFLTSVIGLAFTIGLSVIQIKKSDDGEVVGQETELSYLKDLSKMFSAVDSNIAQLPDSNKTISSNLSELVRISKAMLDRNTALERTMYEMRDILGKQSIILKELQKGTSSHVASAQKPKGYDSDEDF